jgi:hypothetical protein
MGDQAPAHLRDVSHKPASITEVAFLAHLIASWPRSLIVFGAQRTWLKRERRRVVGGARPDDSHVQTAVTR